MTIPLIAAATAADGALNTIMQVGGLLRNDANKIKGNIDTAGSFAADNSLVSFTHPSRVEPLTIIGNDCVHLEYLPDVMQSLSSIFAGYYLQAVAMTTQVNGITVTKMLDRLNPDRKADAFGASLSTIQMGTDSDWRLSSLAYEHRLPTTLNVNAMAFEQENVNGGMNTGSGNPREDYLEQKNAREERLAASRIEADRVRSENDTARTKMANAEKDQAIGMKNHEFAKNHKKELEDQEANKKKSVTATINNDSIKSIREVTDLSVGKMLSVTFGGGTDANGREVRPATIPVSIRLIVNSMGENALVSLLCAGSMDNSLRERYHQWRAGRIDFVRDLILCQDLIDEHKKAMIADHSGIHSEIIRRVSNAKLAGLENKSPSLNVASNLYVISEVTAATIEHKLGGKLSNHNTRNKIFNSSYAMIIVVIDRQWERVTFYHRGIALGTSVSLRDIKISNKGNGGPDIGDILKAYQLGNAPQL
jgi:hypothetical protein